MEGIQATNLNLPITKPRFSGYRIEESDRVRPFLPGRREKGNEIDLQYLMLGEKNPHEKELSWNTRSNQWVLNDTISNDGIFYRFNNKISPQGDFIAPCAHAKNSGRNDKFILDCTLIKRLYPFLPPPKSDDQQLFLKIKDSNDRFELNWNGYMWELLGNPKPISDGAIYQVVEKRPGQREKLLMGEKEIEEGFRRYPAFREPFNFIPQKSSTPSSLGSSLLVFQDSLLSPQQIEEYNRLREAGDKVWSKRTHHNLLGGKIDDAYGVIQTSEGKPENGYPVQGFLSRLNEDAALRAVEFRPISTGDNDSSHGYWTSSLFQLNNKISGHAGFDKVALANLSDGVKVFLDGAFVNEGYNGVHYLSNLYYGYGSPSIKWFDYGKFDQFPYRRLEVGILPVDENDNINYKAWDIRFIKPDRNNPYGIHWVELFDPRFENKKGEPINFFVTNSQDSVIKRRFPIRYEEYKAKKAALEAADKIANPAERVKTIRYLKSEWNNFIFTSSIHDNCGNNWSGQRDVKKIDLNRQDTRDYVRNSSVYMTDKVDRLYTREIAKALTAKDGWYSGISPLDALNLVNNKITRNSLEDRDPGKILPAFNKGEDNPVSENSIGAALERYKLERSKQTLSAARFVTQDLKKNFYLETLPAPMDMQLLLNIPELTRLVKEGKKPFWLKAVTALLGPLFNLLDNKVFKKRRLFERFVKRFTRKSFYGHLEEKLEKSLTPLLKGKLKDPKIGHLFCEEIGRSIYLSLLTGKFIPPGFSSKEEQYKALNPDNLRFNIPPEILNTSPDRVAEKLNDFLIKQLKSFDTIKINSSLAGMLKGITPESAAIASHVIHQRKLGLHWRIDALKDLADMDAIRALPPELKVEGLWKEVKKIKDIMNYTAKSVREVFPTSIIRAEITCLGGLNGLGGESMNQLERQMTAYLLNGDEKSKLNGIPNYTWFYATPYKAIRGTHRPEGEGEVQLSIPDLIKNKLKPMMTAFSMEQALLFQNMTANHDMSNSIHALTLHPHQARFDHYSWFGMNFDDGGTRRGSFPLALNELQYKTQLGLSSQNLPKERLNYAVDQLRALSVSDNVLNNLSYDVKPYIFKDGDRPKEFKTPVPANVKRSYMDELFNGKTITPKMLGLTQEEYNQMGNDLRALFLEPSETKTTRGKLSNSFNQLLQDPDHLANALNETLGLGKQKSLQVARTVLSELRTSGDSTLLDKALWKLSQGVPELQDGKLVMRIPDKHRKWLGYQQLDYIINWTVELLEQSNPQLEILKNPQYKKIFKQTLYNEAVKDALEQFKRIVAFQVACPGDPTAYLPDLLGQAGGEDLKNMFLGNREMIRYDWLKTNPLIQKFYKDVTALLRQRYENHVLNNGFLELPLDPDRSQEEENELNSSTILPMIRDNGKDQAICLVNFGKPESAWDSWMGDYTQKTKRYPEIRSTNMEGKPDPTVYDYSLDLSYLGIPEGTLYKSAIRTDPEAPAQAEYYVVNSNHKLVRSDQHGKPQNSGIDVCISRTLTRI